MAESIIKAVRCNRKKKRKMKNKPLSSCASTDTGIISDNRLSTDEWLVQNTLLFVINFLGVPDVLRCRQVCKLWRDIIDSHHPTWRSLTFSQKHKLKIDQMIPFLRGVKPQYLRFIGCEFVVPSIETSLESSEEARLKSVFQELCICNYPRFPHEIVPRKVYLGWFAETSELKITLSSCYHSYHISDERRIIQSLPGLIRELDNFKLLSIVWHIRQKFYRPEELALPRSSYIPKTRNFPDLKELRFEYYEFPKKNITETVNSVRKLPHLTCLQLSEIEVPEGFETVLKLCTNLNDLIISPLLNKSSMGRINGRIFEGVKHLELKNLVWFFAYSYLQEFRKQFFVTFSYKLESWQTVPFVGDADCLHENFFDPEHKLPAWRLITFPDLKEELQKLMVNCEVTVQMQIDILYFEFNCFR
ncbi:uncharacterized protein [Euwallacea fornicatus]|uniref:uncharacterized protein isoform X3 n=1 Tax=Euwallacea fornicatus TaxID=995702 RepID=UPI00338D4AB0